jgi:hypothetical protein
MPTFITFEKLEKIYLPSSKDALTEEDRAWVVMDVSPQKAADLYSLEQDMSSGQIYLEMVANRIKEWNCTDQTGEPLPVTVDNVGLIGMEDFKFLQDRIPEGQSLNSEEKKTSSDTSPPSETVAIQT